MQTIAAGTRGLLTLAFAGLLVVGPAFADKPAWAGGGKEEHGEKHSKDQREPGERHPGRNEERHSAPIRVGGYFADPQRVVVRDYYREQHRAGRCPPGLAKKRSGCLPPGLAKKWVVGQPLPREVVYYSVPQPLVVQIGIPPPGYRYVRVSSDILLLAIGTGMVVDAIQGLNGD